MKAIPMLGGMDSDRLFDRKVKTEPDSTSCDGACESDDAEECRERCAAGRVLVGVAGETFTVGGLVELFDLCVAVPWAKLSSPFDRRGSNAGDIPLKHGSD